MAHKSPEEKENSRTYAEKRREEKRDALREFVSGQRLLEAINNDLGRDLTGEELPVVKFKTETRLKLLAKVLPDLKAVEVTGEEGGAIQITQITRKLVKPE